MTTATNQIIVVEFELPSLAFNNINFNFRKVHPKGGIALDQNTNNGRFFTIGTPDEAMENTVLLDNAASLVKTHLENVPLIATAEVTITGNSWRIELTETPSIISSGWYRGTDEHYVGLLPLYVNITVFHYRGDDYDYSSGPFPFVRVPVRLSVEDASADDGDGGTLTNVDAGDEPEDQPGPGGPEGDGGGALTNVDAGDEPEDQPGPGGPEGDGGGALTNVDAGDEEEAQPETWLEQQLRLANTPVESGGANDGGKAWRQAELSKGELDHADAGELDGLTLPENAGGAYSGRYGLYWNPGDGGRFQLRFDDDATGALTPAATAAAIDAALEALNGITAAEVTGEPGDWTLTITADEGHLLQAVDVVEGVFFDGDLQLDYMGA